MKITNNINSAEIIKFSEETNKMGEKSTKNQLKSIQNNRNHPIRKQRESLKDESST